ncbi:phage tail protein I [Anaerocolumna sp. MB42-C2]|uniref:phage tail protein I n=1 Tax=Anaerocolumna sp. MB42-C2 TaxID=3070997 RepID=UPI0027E019B4|nr:phage tail protein I [Anaerocolumna sp. MB42-C2]WMJ88854.1 phage tail protein I [Anaerocolumna sp. MB42-C2]
MIDLYESKLVDIVPPHTKCDPKVQAFCYAVDKQVQKILNRCKKIAIWSNLMEVDESLLDYLAAELRTQYYSTSLSVEIKRELVANTLIWYQKAGTVAAVEELVTTLFGEGKVNEWYDYDGSPHHFKIITSNPNITGDTIQEFRTVISQIKRKTAILDTVEIALSAVMNTYYGFFLHTGESITFRQEG